jgi:WD40 repeat protein
MNTRNPNNSNTPITHQQWESRIAALTEQKSWEELWRLVQVAPAIWSLQILMHLKNTGWTPEQDTEKPVFARLVQLAEAYSSKNLDSLLKENYCYATLTGHPDSVSCLAISPDGRVLASGSRDTVQLWSLSDGDLLYTLQGEVKSLTFSPDNQLLIGHVCRRREKDLNQWKVSVRRWRLADGGALPLQEIRFKRPRCKRPLKLALSSSAISPDGRILAEGCNWDPTIRLWDITNGKRLYQLKEPSYGIKGVAFSPDRQFLAGADSKGVVWVWRLADRTLLHRLEGRGDMDIKLVFSSDGQFLTSAGLLDGNVYVWRLSDGTLLHTIEGDILYVGFAITPDEQILVSASLDDIVKFWSLPDRTVLHSLEEHAREVLSLAISPDGLILATGSEGGTIQLWKLWKAHLQRLLSRRTSNDDLKLIQNILQQKNLTDVERRWLEFLLALIRWQKRFDVGEAPKGIPGGEFDVEIEA